MVCAPALIIYRGLPPLEAMGLSLRASLHNLGAILVKLFPAQRPRFRYGR